MLLERWSRLRIATDTALRGPSAASGAVVSWAHRLRAQVRNAVNLDGTSMVYLPLFPDVGLLEFPRSQRSGATIMCSFWHAFVEAVADRDLTPRDSHPLVFVDGGACEFEVTDEWGGGWFLVISPPGTSCSEDERSRSSTPVRRQSPLALTMDAAYLLGEL